MDDVALDRNGLYGGRCDTGAEPYVYERLVVTCTKFKFLKLAKCIFFLFSVVHFALQNSQNSA